MHKWATILGLVWLMVAGVLGAPLLDEPVATLTLKDGTVLREARAKGFLAKVVLVKHEGGIRTVPYELFPEEFQPALAVKRQRAVTEAQIGEARSEAEAQNRPPVRPPPTAPGPVSPVVRVTDLHQGCRVTMTGSKGNLAYLRIENLSDQVAAVLPSQLVARAVNGELYPGIHWVGLNGEGRVSVTLTRRQLIDPGVTATLTLTLKAPPDIEDGRIETVLWK